MKPFRSFSSLSPNGVGLLYAKIHQFSEREHFIRPDYCEELGRDPLKNLESLAQIEWDWAQASI